MVWEEVAAIFTALGVFVAFAAFCYNSDPSNDSIISKMWRMIHLRAMEKLFHNLKNRKGSFLFDIYMCTIDAMNDNLIVEAFSQFDDIKNVVKKAKLQESLIEPIAHAMLTCEESLQFLRETLRQCVQLDEGIICVVLDVLQNKLKPVDYKKYTSVVVACQYDSITVVEDFAAQDFDVATEYIRLIKNDFYIERGAKAYNYKGGVYRIEWGQTKLAIVPHEKGVWYYRHKNCRVIPNPGTRPRAQDTVDELVGTDCDNEVIAWKLLAAILFHAIDGSRSPKKDDNLCEKLVQSFRIISYFRRELENGVKTKMDFRKKRLTGTKQELRKINNCSIDEVFAISKAMFSTAHRQTSSTARTPKSIVARTPDLFTTSFMALDALNTHMNVLDVLIKKATRAGVMYKSRFNVHDGVVLAALTSNKVDGCLFDAYSIQGGEGKYLYHNNNDTKSLYTPFSRVILFATRNYHDIKAVQARLIERVGERQPLRNREVSLVNWIALRGAFEYDIVKRKFLYGTDTFNSANDVLGVNFVQFIEDILGRFTDWFCSFSNSTIYVSNLITLCDAMAERTGASSPWLVREMISMCIVYKAKVGELENEKFSYGRMIRKMRELSTRNKTEFSNVPTLCFDACVSLKGVVCKVDQTGRVILSHTQNLGNWHFELLTNDRKRASDVLTAEMWLQEGKYCEILEFEETAPEIYSDGIVI